MKKNATIWVWNRVFHGRYFAEVVCVDTVRQGELSIVDQTTGQQLTSWTITMVTNPLLGLYQDDVDEWSEAVENFLRGRG